MRKVEQPVRPRQAAAEDVDSGFQHEVHRAAQPDRADLILMGELPELRLRAALPHDVLRLEQRVQRRPHQQAARDRDADADQAMAGSLEQIDDVRGRASDWSLSQSSIWLIRLASGMRRLRSCC